MVWEAALHELPLLLFSVLVPVGLMSLGLIGCVRGFAGTSEEEPNKKLNLLSVIPLAIVVIGLIAAIFHVGSPAHIFLMASGVGVSPLSNEIIVAGLSTAVAAIYWIIVMVKRPADGFHKVFGIVVTVLALATAVFTGLAYMMPTVLTWNTPFSWAGQLFLGLLGGSALAAGVLALAGYHVDRKISLSLALIGAVSAIGVVAVVFMQGGMAGEAMSSAGASLASSMGDYSMFAGAAAVLVVVGVGIWLFSAFKGVGRTSLPLVAFIAVLVGLLLVRVDFYGIFLTAGIS